MDYQTFDKPSLRVLSDALQAVLTGYANEHNLTIKVGNVRFDEAVANIAVEVRIKGKLSGIDRWREQELDQYCAEKNLVRRNKMGWQLVEYAYRSRPSKPFTFTKIDNGARYRCNAAFVHAHFYPGA